MESNREFIIELLMQGTVVEYFNFSNPFVALTIEDVLNPFGQSSLMSITMPGIIEINYTKIWLVLRNRNMENREIKTEILSVFERFNFTNYEIK